MATQVSARSNETRANADRPGVRIHDSAIVDAGASIGAGTYVWHFSHVTASASIGKDCRLGQNVFVGEKVSIGDRVKIQNNVSVYAGVTLEDEVFCGPSCVFTNVKDPRSAFPKDPKAGFAATRVGRGASIGANATIVCGIRIGEHAFIGAGSVVTRDVPAFALVYGNPGRVRGWMCRCGAKLPLRIGSGEESCACEGCGRRFLREELRVSEQPAEARA